MLSPFLVITVKEGEVCLEKPHEKLIQFEINVIATLNITSSQGVFSLK